MRHASANQERNRLVAWRDRELRRDPRCDYCGRRMARARRARLGHACSVDHVVSLHEGGRDHESNYALCCRGCNKAKGGESFPPSFLLPHHAQRAKETVIWAPARALEVARG